MQFSSALVTIRSHAQLSQVQQAQLNKMYDIYSKGVNATLGFWKDIHHNYTQGYCKDASLKIGDSLSHWLRVQSRINREDHWLCYAAAKDTMRQLFEEKNFNTVKPAFPANGKSVRFYGGYDVKVTKGYGILPVIGQISVGRFPKFSGSIIATGLEQEENITYCNVLYAPNPDDRLVSK